MDVGHQTSERGCQALRHNSRLDLYQNRNTRLLFMVRLRTEDSSGISRTPLVRDREDDALSATACGESRHE